MPKVEGTYIPARVRGIPCTVRVDSYTPATPGRTWGPPERCYPDEPSDCSFTVCDQRHRPAPWLERKMTEDDYWDINVRIDDEYQRRKDLFDAHWYG